MKTTNSRFAAPLFCAGAVAASLVFASVGCGSGGGTAPFGLPVLPIASGGSTTLASFLGRAYSSQIALAGGQIGTLSVSVAADGTASGTLQIIDPSRAAAKSRLVIATPFLSGTFDPQTGAITLTGSYTVSGQTIPINITGTLPTPPSTMGGSLTVTMNGKSYTSTFGGSTPVINPTPTPTGSPNPTPSPSASPAPVSGAVRFAVVSKEANCNFSDPGIGSLPVVEARYSGVSDLYLLAGRIQNARKTAIFTVGWQRLHAPGGLVPETFTFVPSPQAGAFGDDFQGILYTGVTIQTGPLSVGAWRPVGGTLTVVSVQGKQVTVRGDKVEFAPTPSPGLNSTGNFIADFTVTLDNVAGL